VTAQLKEVAEGGRVARTVEKAETPLAVTVMGEVRPGRAAQDTSTGAESGHTRLLPTGEMPTSAGARAKGEEVLTRAVDWALREQEVLTVQLSSPGASLKKLEGRLVE